MDLWDKHHRPTFRPRLFLLLLGFAWIIILCFVGFQYNREKQYKADHLDARLQLFNIHLLDALQDGVSPEDFVKREALPFKDLRVSIISLQGRLVYDNILDSLPESNHLMRPEIQQALKHGVGYTVCRKSESDSQEYFYSAMKGDSLIVRAAEPYSVTLGELLETDKNFLWLMLIVTVLVSYIIIQLYARLLTTIAERDKEHLTALHEQQEKIRIKRQLTNNINHELKTPVASIQVCLETLKDKPDLPSSTRGDLIDRCYSNCKRLIRLLEDVSMITRMDEGAHHIFKEEVCLNDIINEALEDMRPQLTEKSFQVEVEMPGRILISGNPFILLSIFRNLTTNAIAYSGGQHIHIAASEDSQYVSILFEDDGTGVDEAHLPHLFERFYRVDKGRSRRLGGTGLGLAIVKHAVLFHGGTIQVENRKTSGLVFTFTLGKR
jgi:signal transduction histidine kinase